MAATVPFRVKDLVHKYGWDAIMRLGALGIQNLAEAQVLYVDANATNVLDADDGVHGHTIDNPLATVDYAIGLCTANEQSIILVAPGHYEDYGDSEGFDVDVAGVKIIGMGEGSLRPRFDFNHANAICAIGADDVVLKNLVFRPSVTIVSVGLDLETGATGCVLEDLEFAMGEKGDGTDEFVKAIHLTSGNHDTVFRNVKVLSHADCDGATHGIHVDAASNRLTLDNVVIDGPFSTGGIVEDAAGLNHVVENCDVSTAGTNYSWHASSTFARDKDSYEDGRIRDLWKQTWAHPKFTPTSSSRVYYVDESNANAGTGTGYGLSWDRPFSTIQAAIDANNSGINWSPSQGEWWSENNFIVIAPSIYTENLTAAPWACTMIGLGGGAHGWPSTEGSAWVNPSSGDALTGSLLATCIYGIGFEGNSSSGTTLDLTTCNNSVIEHCRIHTNVADLSYGIEIDDATRLTIRDCVFSSGTTDMGYGIYVGASSGTTMFGCIFENNVINAVTAGIYVASTVILSGGSWIRNNDIAYPVKGIDLDNTTGNYIRVFGNKICASSDCIEGATATLIAGNWANIAGTADWEPDEAD